MIQALLWLRANVEGRPAIIAVDSVYAGNQVEGWWNKKKNVELIAVAQQLLEQVRKSSAVTFAHVRGHASVEGNERADRLVQWGKIAGPYSRLSVGCGGEGNGRSGRVVGRLRQTKRPGRPAEVELVLDDGEEDEMVKVDQVAGSGTHDDGSGSEVSDGGLEA
eukprot:SAG11_NODE_13123_length_669_cov_0.629825_1_plen_162_part_10